MINFAQIEIEVEEALLRKRAVDALERIANALEKSCGEESPEPLEPTYVDLAERINKPLTKSEKQIIKEALMGFLGQEKLVGFDLREEVSRIINKLDGEEKE